MSVRPRVAHAIIATAASLILAVYPVLTADAATNSPYVTKTEFGQMGTHQTRTRVAELFGTHGKTVTENSQYVWKQYRTAYGAHPYSVDVRFWKNVNGVYRAEEWSAVWRTGPVRAQNPVKKTEYVQIKIGQSLAEVRSIIHSGGKIAREEHVQGSGGSLHRKTYLWPVAYNSRGVVTITFESGPGESGYSVVAKSVDWG
ncbi:hypothetical protein PU630_11670 [Microbacterium horticulturae]|uniref:Uncharacterized protein n=1 Tax=Microbacterium horticulturae TaxID=3028316 RepID=A0ABY8BUP4_9MICO|nr:hypothetical protein [Microbacterium sp. KACC 23027]WEG07898.1 hypothetical protein PU630_11670 [Microbacterium sp. KACC 23027]